MSRKPRIPLTPAQQAGLHLRRVYGVCPPPKQTEAERRVRMLAQARTNRLIVVWIPGKHEACVSSNSPDSEAVYFVTDNRDRGEWACDCAFGQEHGPTGAWCSHIAAAVAAEQDRASRLVLSAPVGPGTNWMQVADPALRQMVRPGIAVIFACPI